MTVGRDVGRVVGENVGVAEGVTEGREEGTHVGTSVGTHEGKNDGDTVGPSVGTAVGTPVGITVGMAVGTEVGTKVGAELGENVSGLNTAWQIRQVRRPTCSPTVITVTVSSPCAVSSEVHMSSCSNKFTPVNVRSRGRIATVAKLVTVPTVPYMAGITS